MLKLVQRTPPIERAVRFIDGPMQRHRQREDLIEALAGEFKKAENVALEEARQLARGVGNDPADITEIRNELATDIGRLKWIEERRQV